MYATRALCTGTSVRETGLRPLQASAQATDSNPQISMGLHENLDRLIRGSYFRLLACAIMQPGGLQRFGETYCLHLQDKTDTVKGSGQMG